MTNEEEEGGLGGFVWIPLSSLLLQKNDGQVGGRGVCAGYNRIINKLFRAVSNRNTDQILQVLLHTPIFLLITGLNEQTSGMFEYISLHVLVLQTYKRPCRALRLSQG